MKEKGFLSKRSWAVIILFGLVGQIAWSVENMYFNLFVFDTVAPDLGVVTLMVQLSGVVATVTTLIAGTLSDKLGNRRSFISYGYLIWGITVALFGALSVDGIQNIFGLDKESALFATLIAVVVADCVMTVFGSTANDASFNAWVTDNTKEEFRGKVEGVLSVLPLVAMLIVAGGFGILVEMIGYFALFLALGIVISVCGLIGIFIVKDSPLLVKNGSVKDIFYGFKPSVVKTNCPFYITLIIMAIYGIACQIFMPYLIIYMKTYLNFSVMEYSVVFGLAIVLGAIINLILGGISDKKDKIKLLYIAGLVMALGLFLMYLFNFESHLLTLALFGVAGFVMITGYIFFLALSGAIVRDYTPEKDAGKLQGVRMIFYVLIPMIVGPMIGNEINKRRNIPLPDTGSADTMTTMYIPAPEIFLAGAIVTLLTLLVIPFLIKSVRKIKKGSGDSIVYLKTDYEIGEIPHSEHPNPQAKRDDYLILNGKWDLYKIKTDGDRIYVGKILVPFSPESINSGIGEGFKLEKNEKLEYVRTFMLEKNLMRGVTKLRFGAVDSYCEVFINGKKVGEHDGGFTPFSFEVQDYILDDQLEIKVLVLDEGTRNSGARGKQNDKRGGIWYTPQSGIWQTVWLESMPKDYIETPKIIPNAFNKTVEILGKKDEEREIIVLDGGKEIIRKTYSKSVVLEYDFTLWSPENPKLYDFIITNKAGDKLTSYFGVRSFGKVTDENGKIRLALNGKPYFFNGVLDQGYWSDGLLTYPSDKAIVDELQMLKDMGFNTLRKHIKLEPFRWYYHCDKIGLVVWQDFVSGGGEYNIWHVAYLPFLGFKHRDDDYRYFAREDEKARESFIRESKETVDNLFNAVSIGLWVPFNEGWGQFDSKKITGIVKEWDDTRIIDSVSGWHDQGEKNTELKSLHIYYTPLKVPKDKRAVVLSEFGGYSMKVEGHVFNKEKEFGYKKFENPNELVLALRKLYLNKLLPLIEKGLSGAIYTQVSDVEDEINGFVTYDRKVIKVPIEEMRKINDQIIKKAKEIK